MMTDDQAREDIRIIKAMLAKTKAATADSGMVFVLWGGLITAAMAVDLVLSQNHLYQWIWLVWLVAGLIGWVASILYGIRRGRREPVTSYVQTAAHYLYIGSGVGFLLVCFIFPLLKVYSYEGIPILFSAVAGILFFVMSGIFESPLLRGLGLLWWLGGIGLIFLAGNTRQLAFGLLIVAGYDIPAILLWAKHREATPAR
jgi:hypothetical protein